MNVIDALFSALIFGGNGGEPAAYIKSAAVEGNTLTLTKKDNSTVQFAPDGLPPATGSGKALVSVNGEWVEQDGFPYEEGGETVPTVHTIDQKYLPSTVPTTETVQDMIDAAIGDAMGGAY